MERKYNLFRNVVFAHGPQENKGTTRKTHFLCNGPWKNKGNRLKVMLLEVVFVDGPEENRVKPILKCGFCTRALAKQSSSRISVARCWLFWFMVLGKTKFQHKHNKQKFNF
jgi:hypothetical protein